MDSAIPLTERLQPSRWVAGPWSPTLAVPKELHPWNIEEISVDPKEPHPPN